MPRVVLRVGDERRESACGCTPGAAAHALAALFWAMLAGCASLPVPPTIDGARLAGPAGVADDALPADTLRPGERIVVAVTTGQTVVERTTTIGGDGMAHVASGQDVAVAGESVQRAQQLIASAISARDKFAEVHVRREAQSLPEVTVLGAVSRPGRVAIKPAMRLSQLIAEAGGTLPERRGASGQTEPSPADLAAATLVRDGAAMPVDFRRALHAEPGHDVYVRAGDLVYVPFVTEGVTVFGQVGLPRIVPYREGLRLSESLGAAGGVLPTGDRDDIRIVRGPVEAPKVYRASLADLTDGEGRDASVLPGDAVFVTDSALENVGEVLGLVAPFATLATTMLLTIAIISADNAAAR